MVGEIKTLQFSEGTATSAPDSTQPLIVGTPTNGTSHAVNQTHLSNLNINLLNNITATVAPTVNDDTNVSTPGYSAGSMWVDVTADKAYICLDATDGAAVWQELGAGGAANSDTIKLYRANVDSNTDWTVKSIDEVLPDFDATDTLVATFDVPSSGSNALLSELDDHAVYHFGTTTATQYDAVGVNINIDRYRRGRDLLLQFEYRTIDDSGTSVDGDYMVWVFDQTNGVNTTTTTTGAQTAGSALTLGTTTGMTVGDKIWVGETGGTTQVTESHIVSISGSDITIAADVNLTSGDRFITGILTDVLTTLNEADSDTDKEGSTFKVSFLTASTTAQVTVMFQQLTTETDSDLYFDNVLLTSAVNTAVTTQEDPEVVRFDGHAGYGSPDDKIPYWTTETTNQLQHWGTITNDATNGTVFTANRPCKVHATLCAGFTTAIENGWSLNSSQLSTSLSTITTANRIALQANVAGNLVVTKVTKNLIAGDVLRPHQTPGTASNTGLWFMELICESPDLSTGIIVDNEDTNTVESGWWYNSTAMGSTNTYVPQFTTEAVNTFSSLLSATNTDGLVFTCLKPCVVTATATLSRGSVGGEEHGWSLNGDGTAAILSGADSTIIASTYTPATNQKQHTAINIVLAAGDVIMPHRNTTTVGAAGGEYNLVTITARSVSMPTPKLVQLPTVSYGQNPEEIYLGTITTGATSHGSTNTKILNFQNVERDSTNNLMSYTATSNTLGSSITILQRCIVHIDGFWRSADTQLLITRNDVAMTTNASTLDSTDVTWVANAQAGTAGEGVNVAATTIGEVGDIFRLHSNGNTTITAGDDAHFSILATPIVSGNTNQAAIIAQPVAYVKDVKASTTVGGSATTSAWTKRDLNTLSGDIGSVGVTLASSVITLPAGKFKVKAISPFYSTQSTMIRIRNTTDSVDVATGQIFVFGTTEAAGMAIAQGVVTLTKSTNLEVQYYTTSTSGTSALGNAISIAGYSEVYTQVEIKRLK